MEQLRKILAEYPNSRQLLDAVDNKGRTALHFASVRGHTKCVEFLLQSGTNVDTRDSDGRTALFEAAAGGYLLFLQQLTISPRFHALREKAAGLWS